MDAVMKARHRDKDMDMMKHSMHGESYNDSRIFATQGASKFLNAPSRFAKDNPLTIKGHKVMSNMKNQYGEKKGKQVFYASINKGKKGSSKWHK